MIKAVHTTLYSLLFMLIVQPVSWSQNTVGLLSYNSGKMFSGYNLMYPHNQPHVFLFNNCGELINTWTDEPLIRPGNSVYLMPNGDLVKCSRHNTVTDDVIWAGGGGEHIEIRDWDNTLKWKFTLNDSLQRIHHDIAVMPNGNILALTWDRKVKEEAIAAGRDSTLLSKGEILSEAILEIKPVGDSFEIVWEWRVWDHLIQDFDPAKPNYGVVADHPELINVNWNEDTGSSSWMHANAIDYNPILDQILISIPTFSEIWIIDHSTSTAEAASHNGGLSGRGGDLMWRWGNPAVYDQGDGSDQQLFFQHNAHWVDAHLDATHPHFGKIAVYNNRIGADSSSVNVLNPLFLDYAWMYAMDVDTTFLPNDFDWSYSHPDKTKMYSNGLSSIQFLPNGNTLIHAAMNGYAFEITGNGEIVWEYKVPLRQGNPVAQGTQLASNENLTWRVNRYPADYGAFVGRDLSGKGFIELNPDTTFCDLTSSVSGVTDPLHLTIFPNPASEELFVQWDKITVQTVRLHDQLGRILISEIATGGTCTLDVKNITPGLYLVSVGSQSTRKVLISR